MVEVWLRVRVSYGGLDEFAFFINNGDKITPVAGIDPHSAHGHK
jgi:hypothetical protein